MITKIEALADALSQYNGYMDPLNILYHLRNPGGLKPFGPYNHPFDPSSGYRYFRSHVDGYKALINDLCIKCSKSSYSGLTPEKPLVELVRVFGMKDETTRYIVKFLKKALKEQALNEETPLKWFGE